MHGNISSRHRFFGNDFSQRHNIDIRDCDLLQCEHYKLQYKYYSQDKGQAILVSKSKFSDIVLTAIFYT